MNITVTIAPSPELLQSLQTLSNALKGISNHSFPIEIPPANTVPPAREVAAEKPVKKVKAEDKPQQETKVTIEAIREMVSTKVNGGKKAEIKALLAEFSAATVSLLSDADFEAFYKKLLAL